MCSEAFLQLPSYALLASLRSAVFKKSWMTNLLAIPHARVKYDVLWNISHFSFDFYKGSCFRAANAQSMHFRKCHYFTTRTKSTIKRRNLFKKRTTIVRKQSESKSFQKRLFEEHLIEIYGRRGGYFLLQWFEIEPNWTGR